VLKTPVKKLFVTKYQAELGATEKFAISINWR